MLEVVVALVARLRLATQRLGLEAQATSVVYPRRKAPLVVQATSGQRPPTRRSVQAVVVVAVDQQEQMQQQTQAALAVRG